MSLRLHRTLGVNPRLTTCPRCGGEGQDLLLLGAANYVDTCNHCGLVHVGGAERGHCQRKGCGGYCERRELGESERVPGSEPCAACAAELAEHKAEVERGGVYFRCTGCGTSGVVKAGAELAAKVREAHGIAAPGLCGVEFPTCPKCEKG